MNLLDSLLALETQELTAYMCEQSMPQCDDAIPGVPHAGGPYAMHADTRLRTDGELFEEMFARPMSAGRRTASQSARASTG